MLLLDWPNSHSIDFIKPLLGKRYLYCEVIPLLYPANKFFSEQLEDAQASSTGGERKNYSFWILYRSNGYGTSLHLNQMYELVVIHIQYLITDKAYNMISALDRSYDMVIQELLVVMLGLSIHIMEIP